MSQSPQSPQPPHSPSNEPAPTSTPPREATFGQVVSAVFWSFFGVRKGKAMQRDAVTIKPLQVVIVGLALAAIFVLTLLLLVRFILSHAA